LEERQAETQVWYLYGGAVVGDRLNNPTPSLSAPPFLREAALLGENQDVPFGILINYSFPVRRRKKGWRGEETSFCIRIKNSLPFIP